MKKMNAEMNPPASEICRFQMRKIEYLTYKLLYFEFKILYQQYWVIIKIYFVMALELEVPSWLSPTAMPAELSRRSWTQIWCINDLIRI